MTAAQKAAKEKFSKAIAYRTKTGVSLKEAFAHVYGKKVGAVKKKAAPKKKAAVKKAAPKKKATVKKASSKKKTTVKKVALVKAAPKKTAQKKVMYNPSQYVSLSGYNFGKEIVVGSISKLSTLKNLVPEVKLRVTRGKKTISEVVSTPEISSEIFKRFIGKNKIETQELFAVAYTNQANKILGVYVHSIGAINAVNVDVRLVLAGALQMGATGMILCHNHPSGNLKPSNADERITKQLQKAAEVHNIQILDHIIITKNGFFSFANDGLI